MKTKIEKKKNKYNKYIINIQFHVYIELKKIILNYFKLQTFICSVSVLDMNIPY